MMGGGRSAPSHRLTVVVEVEGEKGWWSWQDTVHASSARDAWTTALTFALAELAASPEERDKVGPPVGTTIRTLESEALRE